jgi:hypothetical protein
LPRTGATTFPGLFATQACDNRLSWGYGPPVSNRSRKVEFATVACWLADLVYTKYGKQGRGAQASKFVGYISKLPAKPEEPTIYRHAPPRDSVSVRHAVSSMG